MMNSLSSFTFSTLFAPRPLPHPLWSVLGVSGVDLVPLFQVEFEHWQRLENVLFPKTAGAVLLEYKYPRRTFDWTYPFFGLLMVIDLVCAWYFVPNCRPQIYFQFIFPLTIKNVFRLEKNTLYLPLSQ